jgi:hypothetical protein
MQGMLGEGALLSRVLITKNFNRSLNCKSYIVYSERKRLSAPKTLYEQLNRSYKLLISRYSSSGVKLRAWVAYFTG